MSRPTRREPVYVEKPIPLEEALIEACKARGVEAVRSDFFPGRFWTGTIGETHRCGIKFAWGRFGGPGAVCWLCEVTVSPKIVRDRVTRQGSIKPDDDALYDAAVKSIDEQLSRDKARGAR